MRRTQKGNFTEMIDDDEDDVDTNAPCSKVPSSQKIKGTSSALIHAVSIIAAAKSEGKERKFQFLGKHLKQQGELWQKELELEPERLEIEREKNKGEPRRMKLIMMQLQGSLEVRSRNRRSVRRLDEQTSSEEGKLSHTDVIELEHS